MIQKNCIYVSFADNDCTECADTIPTRIHKHNKGKKKAKGKDQQLSREGRDKTKGKEEKEKGRKQLTQV